ncbi:MAG: phage tail sheath subtilisin-like domain-containing protein, partial [Anaerolineae bacterium]|nr:phage tail sheath subtilisin-like domain-containing protein [Anaerolineae bacterium]
APARKQDVWADYIAYPVFAPLKAGEVKLCTSFADFQRNFGDYSTDTDQRRLAQAVNGFFINGGTRCWVGRVAPGSGLDKVLERFEEIDEIALVLAPGITGDDQLKVMEHCERLQDRFAILDCKYQEFDGPPARSDITTPRDSNYAAFYFPWIQVSDPVKRIMDPTAEAREWAPPSGHMAGVYARTDTERGVHKAPAGKDAVVRGALAVRTQVTKAAQDGLNPYGINCIRKFDGNITVWGARTIGGDANGEWKYINVRRLFLFLRESIDEGTQWVVFEPNAQDLWGKITRNVTAFLTTVWRSGALFGATPPEAFYVNCTEQTNPREVRDLGQVITETGVAVVKPAEFVIFRISQWAGPGA